MVMKAGRPTAEQAPARTFKQVAAKMRCSEDTVRKLHNSAIAKIHRWMIERELTLADFQVKEPAVRLRARDVE